MARIASARASVLALLLAGCGTMGAGERLEETKGAWEGATYDEVVARWGAPARSTTLNDGRQTHTWVSQEAAVRGSGPSVGVGVFGGSGGGSGVGVGVGFPFGGSVGSAAMCERTMTFQEGRLVEQSWNGDPGYCSYFRRKAS